MRLLAATIPQCLALFLGLLLPPFAVARADPGPAAWSAFKGLPVASLTIQGLPGDLAGELKAGLALTGRPGRFRGERATFFGETLEQDLARARLFLARQGYPNAEIAADVAAAADRRSVRVTLGVAPGEPVRVREIQAPELPAGVDAAPLPIAAGDPVADRAVHAAGDELARQFHDAGYAFARVDAHVVPVDSVHADVVLNVEAGPRYRVGSVQVDGAAADLEPLVRSTVNLRPDEPYTLAKLRAAEAGLRELDLFRLVRIGVEPISDDRLLVRCQVAERAPHSFGTGLGYYGDEGVRVDAEWKHRNLFRGGRGFAIKGRASRFLQSIRADLVWPRLAGTPTRGILGAAVRRENEEAYALLDTRVDLTARHRAGRHDWMTAGVTVSHISLDVRTQDPGVLDDPLGIVTSVPVSWTHDTFDHPVYPTRGQSIRVQGEVTPPGLGSVVEYARAEAQVSGHRRLIGSAGLAGRVLLGVARPFGPSETVLASRRLFSGGSRSMRGLGRRRLGPQDSSGDPLGGEAKIEASVECRFPLFWRLEGAAFLDAGQVWSAPGSVRLDRLDWAAGPALMVRTPVGPARVDWGVLLERVPGEPRSVVHLSVGHPY